MARRFGGYNPEQSNQSIDNSGRLILKPDLRKDWWVYRTNNHTVVKPYPEIDEQGNPCPARNDNPENPESWDAVLPRSFAVAPLVTYAGRGGVLEMVDICSDIDRYSNGEALRTPYSLFISAVKKLLPNQNGVISAGFTPESLKPLVKNTSYSAPAILMRGAVLMSGGKPSNSKHAVSGVLFRTVFAITQKGARMNFVSKFNEPMDPTMPISSRNFALMNLFAPTPEVIEFKKDRSAPSNSPHTVMRSAAQNYMAAACQFFSLQSNDPREYYSKLRDLYGIYQNVDDCLYAMPVEEMVSAMRAHFPSCLVWYGLRDTPYAVLFDNVARQFAETEDPSMATLFGRQPAVNTQIYSNAPQYQQQPPQAVPQQAQNTYTAPQYQQPAAQQGWGGSSAGTPAYQQQQPIQQPAQQMPGTPPPQRQVAPQTVQQVLNQAQTQYVPQGQIPPNHPAYQQPAAQFTAPGEDQIPMGNAPSQPVQAGMSMPPMGFDEDPDGSEEDPDMQRLRNKFGM